MGYECDIGSVSRPDTIRLEEVIHNFKADGAIGGGYCVCHSW